MHRTILLSLASVRLVTALLLALLLTAANAAAAEKPNIVFILADDHGFNALSATGAEGIETPNIDRIAEQGMMFTDFYVHNRCSPTRMAFMTGSHAQRAGFAHVIYRWRMIGISQDEITTPELLKKAGYATGIVGKWHLGEWERFNPVNHGFDFFYGFMRHRVRDGALYRNKQMIKDIGRKTDGAHSDDLVNAGINFIKDNQGQPFFLYYASPLPHVPWKPSDRFKGSSQQGAYGDVMQELDWQVGRLLETLDGLGLADETLVIYASDNGPQLGIGGEETSGVFRDGKWTNFDGGIRVPCFMRWPGHIEPGSVNDEITAIFDFLPTFCDVAGVSVPSDRVLDGRSILPYMLGQSVEEPIHGSFMVPGQTFRHNEWKLLGSGQKPGGPKKRWGDRKPADAGSLYNLAIDPGETTDLSDKYPAVVTELKRRMNAQMEELNNNTREIGRHPNRSEEQVKELRAR